MEEEQDKEPLSSIEHPLQTTETSHAEDSLPPIVPQADKRWTPLEASTVALPPSSPVVPSPRRASPRKSPAKVRRTPSQQSLASTTSTAPTLQLNKRTSMSSLRGIGSQTPPRSPVSSGRRSSTSLLSGPLGKSSSPRDMPQRPVLTPGSVAKEYFGKDINAHANIEPGQTPDVAVIFHDACYGHRFSRPRTSKANLSTIVERPERILAIVRGVSAAYVLLGDRHSNGAMPPHPTANAGPAPFLIRKSSRNVDITSTAVTNVHGTKWMSELKEMCEAAESRLTQNGKELVRPKDTSGANEDKPRLHEGDLYLCAESLAAFGGALGGVLDAIDTAFTSDGPRRVFACVRPPGHHCSDDYPSGFCWLNNVHVGISHAAMEHGLTHAAIFDFDLHHGDGSQSIAWAHNARVASLPKNAALHKKTSIGYYSLHDINSYPCEWGDEEKVRNASLCIENAHGQSIWNVHLQPWKSDDEFWKLYEERYYVLIEKMRGYLKTQTERFSSMGPNVRPRGAIFISAGFDASEWEGHGMQRHKVNVPTEFYARVTRDIVKLSEEQGLGVDGRVVSVLEGGYSDRALASGVLSHICGLTSTPATPKSLGTQIKKEETGHFQPVQYRNDWWSPSKLEELERGSSATVPAAAKKGRPAAVASYHSPTQSFVAKVVSQPTYQRSVANSLSRHSSASYERPRTPTPPPPEVDWVVASHELSQLIIPQDRQTTSCKPEDLNAKATEARKSRQSTVGVALPPPPSEESLEKNLEKMNLRDRRAKAPAAPSEEPKLDSRAAANRRKTFGGVEFPDKDVPKQPNRRLSAASTSFSMVDDSIVKASPPPVQVVPVKASPAPKSRAAPKPKAPKKTVTKPPIPKAPAIARKPSLPPSSDGLAGNVASNDGSIDDLVSGMKNIRIKLNPPTKSEHDRKEVDKSSVTKEIKKPVRAPRKAPVKKTLNKDSASKPSPALQPVAAAPIVTPTATQSQDTIEKPMEPISSPDLPSFPAPNEQDTPAPPTQVYSNPEVDSMMFNQAPFDPALAEYLADEPHPDLQPIKPQPYYYNWNMPPDLSMFSSKRSSTVDQHQFPQPNYPQPQFNNIPSQATPQNPNRNILPKFTSHSPIPFGTASASNIPAVTFNAPPPVSHSTHQWDISIDNGFGPDHDLDPYLNPTFTTTGGPAGSASDVTPGSNGYTTAAAFDSGSGFASGSASGSGPAATASFEYPLIKEEEEKH